MRLVVGLKLRWPSFDQGVLDVLSSGAIYDKEKAWRKSA